MTPEDLLDAIRSDSERLLSVAGPALDSPIEHLGWSARELVAHQGQVYSMAIANTAAPGTERGEVGAEGNVPDGDRISEWFAERRATLLHHLTVGDPAAECWTFAGVETLGWWTRRMAHETVIHRWDAEYGLTDTPTPIDGDLGADGIDEYAEVSLRNSMSRPDRVYPAETLHLHRTDGPGEWMFARGETEHHVAVTQEHGKGDAAVRGSGGDLGLWIRGRPVEGLEIFGDPDVAAAWQAVSP